MEETEKYWNKIGGSRKNSTLFNNFSLLLILMYLGFSKICFSSLCFLFFFKHLDQAAVESSMPENEQKCFRATAIGLRKGIASLHKPYLIINICLFSFMLLMGFMFLVFKLSCSFRNINSTTACI